MTWFLLGALLCTWILAALEHRRTHPGEFADVEREQRKLAALARACKDSEA